VFGIGFVDAYGHQDCFESFLVDVPSNQQRCSESILLMRTANRTALNHFWWTCRANEKSKNKRIFHGPSPTWIQ